MRTEILIKDNLQATVKETTNNGYVVSVVQTYPTRSGYIAPDYVDARFNFKTFNGAKKWALKTIN